MRRSRHLVTLAAPVAAMTLVVGVACGPTGQPPVLDPLENQVAYVGSEFTLELSASDGDLDELHFDFRPDVPDIRQRAAIRPYGPSRAVFQWTPNAADVGVHFIDFTVTDGSFTETETITIEVKASVGVNDAPIFREPLGTGATLDLSSKSCIELRIVVEDPDTPEVFIDHEPPRIEGAELIQETGFTARWKWCPTREQIATMDRWALTLSADDGDNPKTVKNFLVVLRKPPLANCPGEAPVIAHTPADESTLVGLTIVAEISDAEGLKSEPLFYYTLTPPASPPDLGSMTQLTMVRLDGDMKSGTWGADVPNPVASDPPGTSKTLYYVIVAGDNDDPEGDCDHVTQAPAVGTYQMNVTNPGGSGGLALCQECTADVQCGGPGDNCLRMGSEGKSYCFKACSSDTECPAGYYCSITMMTSVDGASARQCIPETYRCSTQTTPLSCTDDAYEENDTREVASGQTALVPGTYSSLRSCPAGSSGDDEDFYKIEITADSQVTASISGGTATDLDLALLDATGTVLSRSESTTSMESVTKCLSPGTYYLRVYAWGTGENSYSLTFQRQAASCAAACVDDPEEPDDNYQSARRVDTAYPYRSQTNAICSGDDDWYRVYLNANQTIYVTLAFTQTNAQEDLDVLLYRGTTNLIPCSEADPSGCSSNGQSATSNENFQYTVASAGYYYVVVHGWNGSANLYDICIGVTSTSCPPL